MNLGKIVVVDDEENITSSIRVLLSLEGFADLHFFNNPKLALEFLEKEAPDLIISDFLMPDMNGLEFLSEAKKLYPEVSKILLTAYADKENAIRAINEVGIYRYIEKPWDNDDFIMTIKSGIERSNLISELKNKITELDKAKKELEKYSKNLEELVAEKTKDLSIKNAQLSGIITYCADGIIIADENGLLRQTNPSFENMTGISETNLINSNIEKYISHKTLNIKEILKNTEDTEILLRDFHVINELSGKSTPVDINFARITDNSEEKRFIGVVRDVTEQKKSDALRNDFIATLTHDLRTPLLAAIQTIGYFLDGTLGELTDKQRLLLETMLKSNEDLLGLVNALLEVYKYDAKKLVLCKTDFVLKDLINQVYHELKPLAEKKEQEFVINYSPDENATIDADRHEIRRVICNLCGNAINYTPQKGKIEINVTENGGNLLFSVSDNGNGIPEEDIPNLFERFSQGTSQKRSSGTGLGLYLSRQIIEAHGGKIWFESKLNKGSEFLFLLPDAIKTKKERGLNDKCTVN